MKFYGQRGSLTVHAQAVQRIPGWIPPSDVETLNIVLNQPMQIDARPRLDGKPFIARIEVPRTRWMFGSAPGGHVGIGVNGATPTRAGLYKVASMVDGRFGVLASPNIMQPPAHRHWQSRNVEAGSYYVVVYGQLPGQTPTALTVPVLLNIGLSTWKIW